MKYLQSINLPLEVLKDKKYGGKNGKFQWEEIGFNIQLLKAGSIQYWDGGDRVEVHPVSDEAKLKPFLTELAKDCELRTAAITGRTSDASIKLLTVKQSEAAVKKGRAAKVAEKETTSAELKLIVEKEEDGLYYWRRVADNNEQIGKSDQGFTTELACRNNFALVTK